MSRIKGIALLCSILCLALSVFAEEYEDFILTNQNLEEENIKSGLTPYDFNTCKLVSFQKGLWVEVEGKNQPFASVENFKSLDQMMQYPFSDLYIQVYRRGVSWFDSEIAEDTPYLKAKEKGLDDPIRKAIDLAHLRGQRVHAWINMLRIDQNRKASVFKEGGNSSVVVDTCGRSLITYAESGWSPNLKGCKRNQLDTPGIWLDPANSGVRDFYLKLIEELLTKYPDLDGIHFDMIRYPFPRGGTSINTANIEIQRENLTELVKELSQHAHAIKPSMCVSAAVLASRDRAERNSLQDWPRWLELGYLDFAVPMAYTSELPKYKKYLEDYRHVAPNRIVPGIGQWLIHEKRNSLKPFVDATNELGFVIFSYSNLQNKKSLEDLKMLFGPDRLTK